MSIKACKRIITPSCVITHGSFEKALDAALTDIRKQAIMSHGGWGKNVNISISVDVEYP